MRYIKNNIIFSGFIQCELVTYSASQQSEEKKPKYKDFVSVIRTHVRYFSNNPFSRFLEDEDPLTNTLRCLNLKNIGIDVEFLYANDYYDLDNLLKPVIDSLTGVIFSDDVYLTEIYCLKKKTNFLEGIKLVVYIVD